MPQFPHSHVLNANDNHIAGAQKSFLVVSVHRRNNQGRHRQQIDEKHEEMTNDPAAAIVHHLPDVFPLSVTAYK